MANFSPFNVKKIRRRHLEDIGVDQLYVYNIDKFHQSKKEYWEEKPKFRTILNKNMVNWVL